MMAQTTIGWTASRGPDGSVYPGFTFNPWRGCCKVGPGCANCYAEQLAKRNPAALGEWGPDSRRAVASARYWNLPYAWNRRAERLGVRLKVFCGSLMDVFEERPELEPHRERLFNLIYDCQYLDWLLLTKRPRGMFDWIGGESGAGWNAFALDYPHVWLGVSAESQQAADERLPWLLPCPAAVRFVSLEPLLEPIDLTRINTGRRWPWKAGPSMLDCLRGYSYSKRQRFVLNGIVQEKGTTEYVDEANFGAIDWVIVGAESGPKRRPCQAEWIEDLRRQCHEAGVACFVKQGSDRRPGQQGDLPDGLWAVKEFPRP